MAHHQTIPDLKPATPLWGGSHLRQRRFPLPPYQPPSVTPAPTPPSHPRPHHRHTRACRGYLAANSTTAASHHFLPLLPPSATPTPLSPPFPPRVRHPAPPCPRHPRPPFPRHSRPRAGIGPIPPQTPATLFRRPGLDLEPAPGLNRGQPNPLRPTKPRVARRRALAGRPRTDRSASTL